MSDRRKRKANWTLIVAIIAIIAAVFTAIAALPKKKKTTRAEVIPP